MGLDIYLQKVKVVEVFSSNITHNLNEMAKALGLYRYLWRPEEFGISKASELIEPLQKGIGEMKSNPAKYREYDSPNGWGTYDDFLPWLEELLEACIDTPDAEIKVWR